VSRTPLHLARLATLVAAAVCAGACANGVTADRAAARDTPAATSGAAAPRRVASLTLAADEVLVEILAPGRLVAATTAAEEADSSHICGRLPPALPRFFRADLERLLALRPDLVVVSEYTDADFLAQLARSGLSHHRMSGLDSLAGIRRAILELGRAVGAPDAARRLVERFDARLATLAARLAGVARPRVLYWSSPFTAGNGSAIGALIECGGGRNVGAELGVTGVAPIGAERAFLADPDVVLVGRVGAAVEDLAGHPLLSRWRAVAAGRVVALPTAQIVTLSHHLADSCWALAAALHPARFPETAR
jgi:iron complex transport system substrate-binding protein